MFRHLGTSQSHAYNSADQVGPHTATMLVSLWLERTALLVARLALYVLPKTMIIRQRQRQLLAATNRSAPAAYRPLLLERSG